MGKIGDGLEAPSSLLLVFVGFGLIVSLTITKVRKIIWAAQAYQKFGLQAILSVILAVYLANYTRGQHLVYIRLPISALNFGMVYPLLVFVVLAATNAVNLTDGLDSLRSIRGDGVRIAVLCCGRLYLWHRDRSLFL